MKHMKSILGLTLLIVAHYVPIALASSNREGRAQWVGAWSAPMTRGMTVDEYDLFNAVLPPFALPSAFRDGLTDKTVRQIVRVSAGGSKIRIRLQHKVLGSEGASLPALKIAEVRVARQTVDDAINVATNRSVTFNNGQSTVEIVAGGEVVSDPVSLDVNAGEKLAVSIYCAEPSGAPTALYINQQDSYIADTSGNKTSSASLGAKTVFTGNFWLSGIDVLTSEGKTQGTVVAFGDSLTAGFLSSQNAAADYPSRLGARLQANKKTRGIGVINQGISGNAITNGGNLDGLPFIVFGAAGLERMDRDILNQSNVRYVIWLEGSNDIGLSGKSAQQIIDATTQAIKQIKATNPEIQIFGGTLTPDKDNGFGSWTPAGEATRQAVNAWIRTTPCFDAVFDFDELLRDPSDPQYLNPIYNAGDNTHPNDAGYQAMADLIDLSLFFN